MKLRLIILALATILIFCFCSCKTNNTNIIEEENNNNQKKHTTYEAKEENNNKKDEHYVGIYALGSYEYFTDHKIGLKKAGEVLDVYTEYLGPPDNDIDEMIKCFEYAIEERVDGIVVFGANDKLAKMIDKASSVGIPTVTVDGDIEDSKRIAFVGTGNYKAGTLGGNKLVDILGEKGKVAILTEPDVSLHRERTQGYLDVLKKYDNIDVVEIGGTKANPDDAYETAKGFLKNHKDLSAIACTDYFGGIASAIAVEEEDKQGDVKILSMDRNRFVLEKIEEGIITATLVQQTALMPFYAMQILYNYNHNIVPIVSDPKAAGITGAPIYIDTGVFIIDQSNYKNFIR